MKGTHIKGDQKTLKKELWRESEDSCNILVILERNFVILSGELNNISYFT